MPVEMSKITSSSRPFRNGTFAQALGQLRNATTKEQVHTIVVDYVKANGPRRFNNLQQTTAVVNLIFQLKDSDEAWHPRKGAIIAKGFASAQKQIANDLSRGKDSAPSTPVGTDVESDNDSIKTITPHRFKRAGSVLGFFNSSPTTSGNNTPYQSDSDTGKLSTLKRARSSVLNLLAKATTNSQRAPERDSFEAVRVAACRTPEPAEAMRPTLERSRSVMGIFTRPTHALVRSASSSNLLNAFKRSQTPTFE